MVTGGHYDVDMTLEGPRNEVLYQGIKKQFDTFTWTPSQAGIYTVCFSNEFSTFSHKLVYFDFQVGEEAPLPGTSEHLSAMTKVAIINCFVFFLMTLYLLTSFRWSKLHKQSMKVWTL